MEKNYAEIFEELVQGTQYYVLGNGLRAMVLGISGGIDSTVVAAICHEVSIRTGIPLIGRSLPTKFNKEDEVSTANLVGKAFCSDYKVANLNRVYYTFLSQIMISEKDNASWTIDDAGHIVAVDTSDFQTPLANGNIQARLRMIYLYNLASIYGGLVMDTDNLTENNLGYFTIHGDVGDFNPIGGLWKTEIFELAKWLLSYYSFQLPHNMYEATSEQLEKSGKIFQQGRAIKESLKLKPTAGLGITNNDLEEIGADSYDQVDDVLKVILAWKMITVPQKYSSNNFIISDFMSELTHIPEEIIKNVATRHFRSEFKRKHLPIKL